MIDTTLVYCGPYLSISKILHRYVDEGDSNRECLFTKTISGKAETVNARYQTKVLRYPSGRLEKAQMVNFVSSGLDNPVVQSLQVSIAHHAQLVIAQKAEAKLARESDALGDLTLREIRESAKRAFGTNRKVFIAMVIEYITR